MGAIGATYLTLYRGTYLSRKFLLVPFFHGTVDDHAPVSADSNPS